MGSRSKASDLKHSKEKRRKVRMVVAETLRFPLPLVVPAWSGTP